MRPVLVDSATFPGCAGEEELSSPPQAVSARQLNTINAMVLTGITFL